MSRPHIDLSAEPRPTISVGRLLSPLTSPLFTCSTDDGRPLSEALLPGPSEPGATTDPAGRRWLSAPIKPPLEWSDVAVGMMVGLGHGAFGASPPDPAKAPRSRPQLEARLLQLGREGWMAHTPGLGLLLLADCKGVAATSSGPQWLMRPVPGSGGAQLRWRCYTGPAAKLGVSLWRKTEALLRALWDEYSQRRYFLKLDADAFLLPGALLAFLRFLDAALHPSSPAYFGNNRIASAEKYCIHRRCLLRSAAWQALLRRRGRADHDDLAASSRAHPPSYAQGGAYGFNAVALRLLSNGGGSGSSGEREGGCLSEVADVIAAHGASGSGLKLQGLYEDEAVGLCMHSHRVPLINVPCFYDWGPCNCFNASSCHAGTARSKLHRLPLSMHKLRQVSWYEAWWQMLAPREPTHLRELARWERMRMHDHERHV